MLSITSSLGSLGEPGCKNIRLGGDTMQDPDLCDGPFLTYIVYRSFKTPPPVK